MPQVVTNENVQQFIETRSVPEFVPPSPTATVAQGKPPAPGEPPEAPKTGDNSAAAPIDNAPAEGQARDSSGKFVKKDSETAAQPAGNDDDDDALPERVKRQIGKKHRAMKEAEEIAVDEGRRRIAAEARAQELERKLAQLETKSNSAPAQARLDGEPRPEDFKTVAEYADALTDWKLDQKLKARDEEAAKQRVADENNQRRAAFSEQVAKARKEIADFDEVVREVDTQIPGHMVEFLEVSPLGAVMGYHLAKHPDELDRLMKLPATRAIAELGKLEAKLEKPAAAPEPAATRQVSRAPSPITPLAESASTVVTKDPSTMTFQELRAHRQAERASGKRF